MDWFLYYFGLRHERVKEETSFQNYYSREVHYFQGFGVAAETGLKRWEEDDLDKMKIAFNLDF